MASNLDRSLDEILATRPRGAGRRGGKPAAAAVVGGVRKRSSRVAAQKANASIVTPTNPTTTRAKGIPTGPSGKVSASKIIVSNLVCRPVYFPATRQFLTVFTAFRCFGADD